MANELSLADFLGYPAGYGNGCQYDIIHKCPSVGESLTPCCHMSVFELPRNSRMTLEDDMVTCNVDDEPIIVEAKDN